MSLIFLVKTQGCQPQIVPQCPVQKVMGMNGKDEGLGCYTHTALVS